MTKRQYSETVTLFRPVGQKELDLVKLSEWRAFPPRLPFQPIFYPVLNLEYAQQIARDWNTKDEASGYVGYVLRWLMDATFLAQYEMKVVGGSEHEEYWIPAAYLNEFNLHIIGTIEIVSEFRP